MTADDQLPQRVPWASEPTQLLRVVPAKQQPREVGEPRSSATRTPDVVQGFLAELKLRFGKPPD